MSRVLNWNGRDVPEELRGLPAGRYVVQSLDEATELTEHEEQGLRQALSSLRSGDGLSIDEVRATVDTALNP